MSLGNLKLSGFVTFIPRWVLYVNTPQPIGLEWGRQYDHMLHIIYCVCTEGNLAHRKLKIEQGYTQKLIWPNSCHWLDRSIPWLTGITTPSRLARITRLISQEDRKTMSTMTENMSHYCQLSLMDSVLSHYPSVFIFHFVWHCCACIDFLLIWMHLQPCHPSRV